MGALGRPPRPIVSGWLQNPAVNDPSAWLPADVIDLQSYAEAYQPIRLADLEDVIVADQPVWQEGVSVQALIAVRVLIKKRVSGGDSQLVKPHLR